jgi:hypothetical protein
MWNIFQWNCSAQLYGSSVDESHRSCMICVSFFSARPWTWCPKRVMFHPSRKKNVMYHPSSELRYVATPGAQGAITSTLSVILLSLCSENKGFVCWRGGVVYAFWTAGVLKFNSYHIKIRKHFCRLHSNVRSWTFVFLQGGWWRDKTRLVSVQIYGSKKKIIIN